MRAYIEGRKVTAIAPSPGFTRGSGNRWLQWYDGNRCTKKVRQCRGVVADGDKASFWLDGTLNQTWARVGCQRCVDTFGVRKTAHVFGIVTLEQRPRFLYQFAPVFNGITFLAFLKEVVRRSHRRKTLIIDNGPCHNLDEEGKLWLASHRHRIELFRSPPCSPEFNPIEGVWKVTMKRTTHTASTKTTEERDAALCSTFGTFQARPSLIANHVARFYDLQPARF